MHTYAFKQSCTNDSCNTPTRDAREEKDYRDQLSVAHFAAGLRSHSMRCSRAHCASTVVLRFSINVRVRSQLHRTSSSTKCSGRARRSGAASGWVASVAQGARGCGWSKHESGPALHALQLFSIEYVPPMPTSRERELPTVLTLVSEMSGRLPR